MASHRLYRLQHKEKGEVLTDIKRMPLIGQRFPGTHTMLLTANGTLEEVLPEPTPDMELLQKALLAQEVKRPTLLARLRKGFLP